VDQGKFSIIAIGFSSKSISISGNPTYVAALGKTKITNLGGLPLTGITYDVLGLDAVLYSVEVDHPTNLAAGYISKLLLQLNMTRK
jgi:hypothetical protein